MSAKICCALRAKPVGRMRRVGQAERDAADDAAVLRNAQRLAQNTGVGGQRGLRNGRHAQAVGGQQKIANVGAAVHRAIHAQGLVAADDGHMRRTEHGEVLGRLPCRGLAVALGNAQGFVKAPAAFAAPLLVDAPVFARPGQVGRRGLGGHMGLQGAAQARQRGTAGNGELPGLRIAP